jgi:hypothetical protein
MPEVQEVFRMATQKVRPDPDSLEQQHRDQRRHASRQKATVFVLVGALVLGGAGFAITQLGSDGTGEPLGSPTASPPPTTASSLPTVGNGVALEPGRYVISTSDQAFNASTPDHDRRPGGIFRLGGGRRLQGPNGWRRDRSGHVGCR